MEHLPVYPQAKYNSKGAFFSLSLSGNLDLWPYGAAPTFTFRQPPGGHNAMLFHWHSAKEGFLLCPHPGSSDSSDRDENKVTLGQHLCGTLEATESWPRWPGRRYHSVCNIWEPKLSCCGTQMGKSKNRFSCLQENTGAPWYWGYLSRTLGEGVVPRHTLGKRDYVKEDIFYGQVGK